VRFAVDWKVVEPRRDAWDAAAWRRYRATAQALAARGIEPLAVLTNGPKWAGEDRLRPAVRRSGYVPIANLDGDRRWRLFVATAVRELPGVGLFELWNEPNLPGSWGGQAPDPVHYARLVRVAAPVIHRLRPGARVLAGAIAGVDSGGYVRCLFQPGGIAGSFDAFSLHAYPPASGGRVERLGAGSSFQAQVAATADAVRAFAPRTRLWVTETGVSTSGPRAVAGAEQARATADLWRTLAARADVDGVVFHALFDVPALPATDAEQGYGWVGLDPGGRTRAKPVVAALAALSGR
jgi:hypothetical protein